MRAYLALCRFPAVFTAIADVFLGYALTAGTVPSRRFYLTMVASSGLYLSGMVLNDLLDVAKDTAERPNRPIPSGKVSTRNAWIFYAVLTAIGVTAAAFVGPLTAGIAAALVITIWLYDGPLKATLVGPLVMGSCRAGNILLAASAGVGSLTSISDPKVIWIASAMGVYICGLTWFARQEAGRPGRAGLLLGLVIANGGLAGAIAWTGAFRGESASGLVFAALIAIAAIINQRAGLAVVSPNPVRVQAAVKTMLLSLPPWNAALIAMVVGSSGLGWSLATASLLVPGLLIARFLRVT